MTMIPDSVSFTLWRQGSGSAADYAVLSSQTGFSAGQQLGQSHLTTVGSGNQQVVTGMFGTAQPTTDAVEFRLYGWNAASELDSTHVIGASMRARFASIVGTPIDPTGNLSVQGDFYHLAGGELAIDLGGHAAGVDYDAVNVAGKVELEGDLIVSLAGGGAFTPETGDVFSVLTATQGISGQFVNVALPQLAWNLDWRVDYLANAVNLVVWTSGDFNHDGFVNSGDYVVWRKNNGTQADYAVWRSRFGIAAASGSGTWTGSTASAAVPEPASNALVFLMIAALSVWGRATWAGRPASSS
jgi:hypothetical protein